MRPTPATRLVRGSRLVVVGIAAVLVLAAPACSDGDDTVAERANEATTAPPVSDACPEAQALVAAIDELLASDVVAIGTDGLRGRVVAVTDAWEDLRPAVAASNEAESEAVAESMTALRSVDLANGSARAVAEYAEALRSVRAAWQALLAEIRDDIDDCDLSSSAATAGG